MSGESSRSKVIALEEVLRQSLVGHAPERVVRNVESCRERNALWYVAARMEIPRRDGRADADASPRIVVHVGRQRQRRYLVRVFLRHSDEIKQTSPKDRGEEREVVPSLGMTLVDVTWQE